MTFEDYLVENVALSAVQHTGIKLQRDSETGEHSTTIEKNNHGHLKVNSLHNHLKKEGWKHKEHPSGHVFTHPVTRHTVTIYHKSHGPGGDNHHEIVLGKS